MAEADGNRTRLTGMPGHNGFEDRARHQTRYASGVTIRRVVGRLTRSKSNGSGCELSRRSEHNERVTATDVRLTQYAAGGGCACKIPPGELEHVLADLGPTADRDDLVVGLEHGDDAAVVRVDGGRAVVMTADFFTPVVDNPFDWGRIAAANALSDVYAMGGEPVVAVNLLAWPRDRIPFDLAAEVLRGGSVVCHEAGCHLAGGNSIDAAEPESGPAV